MGGRQTVLLVDQEPEGYDWIETGPEREVVRVHELSAALLELERRPFDRVLLGKLPGTDALDLLYCVRRHPTFAAIQDIEVVLLASPTMSSLASAAA